jgi:hypothetical protein
MEELDCQQTIHRGVYWTAEKSEKEIRTKKIYCDMQTHCQVTAV